MLLIAGATQEDLFGDADDISDDDDDDLDDVVGQLTGDTQENKVEEDKLEDSDDGVDRVLREGVRTVYIIQIFTAHERNG